MTRPLYCRARRNRRQRLSRWWRGRNRRRDRRRGVPHQWCGSGRQGRLPAGWRSGIRRLSIWRCAITRQRGCGAAGGRCRRRRLSLRRCRRQGRRGLRRLFGAWRWSRWRRLSLRRCRRRRGRGCRLLGRRGRCRRGGSDRRALLTGLYRLARLVRRSHGCGARRWGLWQSRRWYCRRWWGGMRRRRRWRSRRRGVGWWGRGRWRRRGTWGRRRWRRRRCRSRRRGGRGWRLMRRGSSRGGRCGFRRRCFRRLLGLSVGAELLLRRGLRYNQRRCLRMRKSTCELHCREGCGGKQREAKFCHDDWGPRKVVATRLAINE